MEQRCHSVLSPSFRFQNFFHRTTLETSQWCLCMVCTKHFSKSELEVRVARLTFSDAYLRLLSLPRATEWPRYCRSQVRKPIFCVGAQCPHFEHCKPKTNGNSAIAVLCTLLTFHAPQRKMNSGEGKFSIFCFQFSPRRLCVCTFCHLFVRVSFGGFSITGSFITCTSRKVAFLFLHRIFYRVHFDEIFGC